MDLKELVQISTAEAHQRNFLKDLTDAFARFSKPIVAAVAGFAVSNLACSKILDILTSEQLGGGCEIALAVSDHDYLSVTPETEPTADALSVISFTLKKVPNSDSQR